MCIDRYIERDKHAQFAVTYCHVFTPNMELAMILRGLPEMPVRPSYMAMDQGRRT